MESVDVLRLLYIVCDVFETAFICETCVFELLRLGVLMDMHAGTVPIF